MGRIAKNKKAYKGFVTLSIAVLILASGIGYWRCEVTNYQEIKPDNYNPPIGYTRQIYHFEKNGQVGSEVSDVQEELVTNRQAYTILHVMLDIYHIEEAGGLSNWRLVDPLNITCISNRTRESYYIFGYMNQEDQLDSHLIYISKKTGRVWEAYDVGDEIVPWEVNNGGGEYWVFLDQPPSEMPTTIPYPEGLLEKVYE